ncbi:MAG: TonB-dependent receptor domain-containing protein [Beijerinckiaceae bacterium]
MASGSYQDLKEERELPLKINVFSEAYVAEAQYLLNWSVFDAIVGGGYNNLDRETAVTFPGNPTTESDATTRHGNAYVYTQTRLWPSLTSTLGASFDSFDDDTLRDFARLNPKIGLTWDATPNTTLRLAAFRVFKRALVADQTLEPTQLAGFNQFFDDLNATESWRLGFGIDHKFLPTLYGGMEVSKRDLEVAVIVSGQRDIENWAEELYRAYLYWTPHPRWAASIEYERENFDRREPFASPPDTETDLLPIGLSYHDPSGFFTRLQTTYVHQNVEMEIGEDHDKFALVDATIGYRLPNRYGTLSFSVKNIFDDEFNYRGLGFRTSQRTQEAPPFLPELTMLGQISLAF